MSNWTHVAGIIRIDAVRLEDETVEEATRMFENYFGKELRYHSEDELWYEADEHPEKFLPFGSEGSLTMSVWVNPDLDSITSYTVSIFGDLRDHDDPDAIIEWFEGKCKSEYIYVRNACITVENDLHGSRFWNYTDD